MRRLDRKLIAAENERTSTPETRMVGEYLIPSEVERGVAVDFGACVGLFPKNAYDRFDAVFCFEPYYPNFLCLMEETKDMSNVFCYPFAMWNVSGVFIPIGPCLNVKNPGPENMLIGDGGNSRKHHLAPTLSFGDIIRWFGGVRISYLKCDIETSEYAVFENVDLSCVDFLGIELHSDPRRKCLHELLLKTFDLIDKGPRREKKRGHLIYCYRNKRLSI